MSDSSRQSVGPLGADLIPVPAELSNAWERVQASRTGDRMRRALYRVALGEPYRAAAEAEGYRDHRELYKAAKRFGLAVAKRERILDGFRRVADLSNQELEKQLVEDPDSISTRDLIVAGGVAADKLAKAENWGRREVDGSFASALQKIANDLIDAGVKLELTVEPRDPVDSAVDVAPSERA